MNVGDKVRVKKVDYYLCEASEGAEGEVTLTNLAGRHPIGVRLTKESPHALEVTSLPRIYPYREEDLEVIKEVKPVAKFNVGDKVFINRCGIDDARGMGYDRHGLVEGMTGVVTAVTRPGNLSVAWDHPTAADVTHVRALAVGLVVKTAATPVTKAKDDATATPEARAASTVKRFICAQVEGVRFERRNGEVSVYNDGDEVASLTFAQLREVMAILEGVA